MSFTETTTINTRGTKFRTHLVLTNLSPKNRLRTTIAQKFTITHCHSKETSCSVIPPHNITLWFVFFIFYLLSFLGFVCFAIIMYVQLSFWCSVFCVFWVLLILWYSFFGWSLFWWFHIAHLQSIYKLTNVND